MHAYGNLMLLTKQQHWGGEGATYENLHYNHMKLSIMSAQRRLERHFSVTDHQSVTPVHT